MHFNTEGEGVNSFSKFQLLTNPYNYALRWAPLPAGDPLPKGAFVAGSLNGQSDNVFYYGRTVEWQFQRASFGFVPSWNPKLHYVERFGSASYVSNGLQSTRMVEEFQMLVVLSTTTTREEKAQSVAVEATTPRTNLPLSCAQPVWVKTNSRDFHKVKGLIEAGWVHRYQSPCYICRNKTPGYVRTCVCYA